MSYHDECIIIKVISSYLINAGYNIVTYWHYRRTIYYGIFFLKKDFLKFLCWCGRVYWNVFF